MSDTAPALRLRMRPEVARRRIAFFEKRFGEAHLYLAYHAAFPLALTPDLLYRLWANFPRNIHGEPLKIPWVAVADLLLSNLCNEVGHELYEMDTAVRTALLHDLKADPNFGSQRINELSDFLLAYVQQQLNSPDPDIQDIANAQTWTALAYTQSQEAARDLALALRASLEQGDRTEQVRLTSLIETFAEPLAGFTPLLTYARGVGYLARGWGEDAEIQFNEVAGTEQSIMVGGIHLPIPRQSRRKRKTEKQPDGAGKAPGPTETPKFRPLPPPTGSQPYHLALDNVLPPTQMQTIRSSGRLVFHIIGSTGSVKNPQHQQIVANKMLDDFNVSDPTARPSYFYILGDVIFYHGEAENYYAQFYEPYRAYPAPIFAIPGNHDGDVFDQSKTSLEGFVRNFCAPETHYTAEAGDVPRLAMTQPNVYWTLDAPFVTIVGLYTNVPEGGRLDDYQIAWLESELASAPADKALIVTMHHPIYSADTYHSGSAYMHQVLDQASQKAGRMPDAVFAGHVHNYQRFTRSVSNGEVPYIVAATGGYPNLHAMMKDKGKLLQTPYVVPETDVTLESYCDDRHGYMRVEITSQMLKGEYYTVPRSSEPLNNPVELRDSFTLDLRAHRVSPGSAPFGGG